MFRLLGSEDNRAETLGLRQLAILSAIRSFPENAYGSRIATILETEMGHEIGDGNIYISLRRLESRFLIELREPSPSLSLPPGAQRRKLYVLTPDGDAALKQGLKDAENVFRIAQHQLQAA